MAAFSICFLWFKVFDWLRLFSGTAFFIELIKETLMSIRYFLLILFVWYMMFGTAFYILSMSLDSNELVPNVSPFWFFDAFISIYELGLGEFQVEVYRETS